MRLPFYLQGELVTNCFKNRYTLQVSNDTVAFCLDVIVSSFHLILSLLNIFVVSSSKETLSWEYCCFRSILCWSHYLVPLLVYKMFLQSYEEHIKQTLSGSTNHNYNFLVIFGGITLKLSTCSCRSFLSVATDDRKQLHCLNIVWNNKTGPLPLEFKEKITNGLRQCLFCSRHPPTRWVFFWCSIILTVSPWSRFRSRHSLKRWASCVGCYLLVFAFHNRLLYETDTSLR